MMAAPTISELVHHIKQCPFEFMAPPMKSGKGDVNTEALVNDIFRILTNNMTAPRSISLAVEKRPVEELTLIQICCWVLSHPFFKEIQTEWIKPFLCRELAVVAPLVKPELWVWDEERAEELARMMFSSCGQIPGGETPEEAQDRYDSVNTVKRLKIIAETNAANERAREIRRQMAEAKAREAANVYGRE